MKTIEGQALIGMRASRMTTRKLAVLSGLAMAFAGATANAEFITFGFLGHLNDGRSLSGQYVFDDQTEDRILDQDNRFGAYFSNGPDSVFQVTIGDSTFVTQRLDITVVDHEEDAVFPGVFSDRYEVTSDGENPGNFLLRFSLPDSTYSSDQLPSLPPQSPFGQIFISGFGLSQTLFGNVNTMCVGPCPVPGGGGGDGGGDGGGTSVPEPSTFALMAMGIVPMLLRRRGKQRPISRS